MGGRVVVLLVGGCGGRIDGAARLIVVVHGCEWRLGVVVMVRW